MLNISSQTLGHMILLAKSFIMIETILKKKRCVWPSVSYALD